VVLVAVVSGPDPGHLLPTVAVGDGLRRRGHDVTVVTTPRWEEDVLAAGFSYEVLPRAERQAGDADFGWRMWDRAAEMAPDIVEVFRRLGVEVVVVDTLTTAGGFAADLLGIPWVEVTPHWLWEPSRSLPPVGLGQRPARTVVGRGIEHLQRRQQQRSVTQGEEQRARARARVGLPPCGPTAVLHLVGAVPAIEPPRLDWPPRTHLVGSLEWSPPSWPDLAPPPGDGPLVVVTDSTAANVPGGLARAVVTGMCDADVRVVATTTAAVAERRGVRVGRGRHGPLLDVADCAVGPGGGGFVGKALTRGVPLVLVPAQGDQRETAARIARTGAGVRIAPEELTPGSVSAAIRGVLGEPRYREGARRCARSALGLGADRAALLVERRAGRCSVPHIPGSGGGVPRS
jgi:UDP:flavonoid glycosyltransferase YjiC (YdhE family)